MAGNVIIVGTLDTKGAELRFLGDAIAAQGAPVLIVDVGVLGPPAFIADIGRDVVAAAAGVSVADLMRIGDRGQAVERMAQGAARVVADLYARGEVAGVIAIGGSGNATIGSAAMRALPIGVPKLLVTTVAAGDTRPYVGAVDIAMLYPVVDISGLNRLSRRVLANAAGAIVGMIAGAGRAEADIEGSDRPLVAATMFGVTTPCVTAVRERLEASGHEVLVFHATGVGGRSMETLVRDGYITGVLDLTTTELADEVVGGALSAGPHRLEAAGQAGIPQVVSLGALDMVNFGPLDTVPERFRGRHLYQHNAAVTLMRTTTDENIAIGQLIADKLNRARGPVALLLPLHGVSALDAPGAPFYDFEADAALFATLRARVQPQVEIVAIDAHINDPAFAVAVVDTFQRLTMTRKKEAAHDLSH